MATSYKGNTDVRVAWESGRKTRGDIDTLTLVKKGKYVDLLAIQPIKGNELITGFTVNTSTLESSKGGMGTLTIDLVEKDASTFGPGGTLPDGAITCVVETEMAQLEKPLLTHPSYASESASIAENISRWKAEPDSILRSQYKYKDADSAIVELAGLDLQAAKKIMKGVESYLMFVPVITRTTTWKARKAPSDIGKIDSPPISVPGTWAYLKTADKCSQQADKKYVQVEQWTGSKEWDTDLYENS